MKMQRVKQAHIHAHLQRAAELLQFGTNPGDMLKLQTVDSNQQMTLWVKVADDALPHKKQIWEAGWQVGQACTKAGL